MKILVSKLDCVFISTNKILVKFKFYSFSIEIKKVNSITKILLITKKLEIK